MTDTPPQPRNNWELVVYRLDSMEKSIKELGGQVVPMNLYTADKQAASERAQRAETAITKLETNQTEADKLKRSQRLTIALTIASPFLAIIAAVLTREWVV